MRFLRMVYSTVCIIRIIPRTFPVPETFHYSSASADEDAGWFFYSGQ